MLQRYDRKKGTTVKHTILIYYHQFSTYLLLQNILFIYFFSFFFFFGIFLYFFDFFFFLVFNKKEMFEMKIRMQTELLLSTCIASSCAARCFASASLSPAALAFLAASSSFLLSPASCFCRAS